MHWIHTYTLEHTCTVEIDIYTNIHTRSYRCTHPYSYTARLSLIKFLTNYPGR